MAEAGASARDDEIDSDGLVSVHSGMGYRLGTARDGFFDHGKTWSIARTTMRGSWYRLFDGDWEFDNHAQIARTAQVGKLIHTLVENAGPVVGTGRYSGWPRRGAFTPSRGTVLVFVHGATNDPAYPPFDGVGTKAHFPHYWGHDLVREALGGGGLKFASNDPVTAQEWRDGEFGGAGADEHFLLPERRPRGSASLSAMVTYRDGSKKLVEQTGAAIDQVYGLYVERFGEADDAPQIAFVAHSMGGLVVRCLLSNPSDRLSGAKLTAEQRRRADFLRARTTFVVTLATPHEGSPMADKFSRIANLLDAASPPWVDQLQQLVGLDGVPSPARFVGMDRDATRDLRTNVWRAWNTGPLRPDRACRPDGSLVPIYVLCGRSPGGGLFDEPNRFEVHPGNMLARETQEAVGLVLLDWALHNVPGTVTGWGSSRGLREFDRVQRTSRAAIAPLHTAGAQELIVLASEAASMPVAGNVAATLFGILMRELPIYARVPWRAADPLDVARCLKDVMGKGAGYVSGLLVRTYGMTRDAVAKVLQAAGYAWSTIAAALREQFVASTKLIAKTLKDLGASVQKIAEALHEGVRAGAVEIVKALQSIGAGAVEIAQALVGTGIAVSAKAVAIALKAAGVAVDVCTKALRAVFGAALGMIAKALRAAGYVCDQVALGLKQLRNDAIEVAKALRQAGYDPLATAKALRKVFNLSVATVTQILASVYGLAVGAVTALLQPLLAPSP